MAIKLVALDIDGTLTDNLCNEISPRNLAAIAEAQRQGVFVTVATGRACVSSKPIWRAIGLQGPAIQYGGAWTVDTKTGETLDQKLLDPYIVRDVFRYARDIGVEAQLYCNDVLYVQHENAHTARYIAKNGMQLVIDPDICDHLYEQVPKVVAFSDAENEPAMRTGFEERFRGVVHIARSQPTFIEINDFTATKGQALRALAERMGIQSSEVAAIGDSYLDLDMIEWAGTGVCVENGWDDVKNAADRIVPSCRDDGVAYYIEHDVLH